jgi:hypothetical protein
MSAGQDDDELRARDVIAAQRDVGAPSAGRGGALDLATQAKLARWFGADETGAFSARGLPDDSDEDDADDGADAPDDGGDEARRTRRADALAAIDPALVARLAARATVDITTMSRLPPAPLVVRDLSRVDPALIARTDAIAEPREVEIPEQLRDDLRECTPQALLRDLERPIFEFSIEFEHGLADEAPLDAGAAARAAMATSSRRAPTAPLGHELAAHAAAMRTLRATPWRDLPTTVPMAYRREDVS